MERMPLIERLLSGQRAFRPVAVALLAGYPLLFLSGYAFFGMGAIMLGLLPITVAAWGWQRRTALLATVLVMLAHMVMLSWVAELRVLASATPGYVAGHILMAVMAVILGTLFEQYRRTYGDLISARRLNADLEAYTRTVAHDLKNPLASFVSTAHFLRTEWADRLDETSRELLISLEEQSQLMMSTVDGLLKLARVENEAVELEPTDVAAAARRAWAGLADLRLTRSPRMHWPGKWPRVHAYPPWLEEVWANLLSNAVKYGGEPPVIFVDAIELDEDRIRFIVEDNGDGIPESERAVLVQEFSRRPRAGVDSNGIGLTIVQRILYRLGSEMEIGSAERFPSGTRISFVLPRNAASAHPKPPRAARRKTPEKPREE